MRYIAGYFVNFYLPIFHGAAFSKRLELVIATWVPNQVVLKFTISYGFIDITFQLNGLEDVMDIGRE